MSKTRGGKLWLATAMSVFARLCLWAAIAPKRDEGLIKRVIGQVRGAAKRGQAILFAVDGFRWYVTAIVKTFRDLLHTGQRGRPRLLMWPDLHLVRLINHRAGRKLVWLSSCDALAAQKFSDSEQWVITYMREQGGRVVPAEMGAACKGDVVQPARRANAARKAMQRLQLKGIVERIGKAGRQASYELTARFMNVGHGTHTSKCVPLSHVG